MQASVTINISPLTELQLRLCRDAFFHLEPALVLVCLNKFLF